VDWRNFYAAENRNRLPLPAYPFERTRCWIEGGKASASATPSALQNASDNVRDFAAAGAAASEGSTQGAVPARDNVEHVLCEIWKDLLGLAHLSPADNFFDLGGTSLMAAQLFSRIERTFGRKLPLATLYAAPTAGELASVLRGQQEAPSWDSLVEIERAGSRPPLYLVHGAGGNVLIYHDLARHLGPDQPVYGLQSQGLNGSRPFLTG